jgi:flagellin-like hook-associated protein FlgL
MTLRLPPRDEWTWNAQDERVEFVVDELDENDELIIQWRVTLSEVYLITNFDDPEDLSTLELAVAHADDVENSLRLLVSAGLPWQNDSIEKLDPKVSYSDNPEDDDAPPDTTVHAGNTDVMLSPDDMTQDQVVQSTPSLTSALSGSTEPLGPFDGPERVAGAPKVVTGAPEVVSGARASASTAGPTVAVEEAQAPASGLVIDSEDRIVLSEDGAVARVRVQVQRDASQHALSNLLEELDGLCGFDAPDDQRHDNKQEVSVSEETLQQLRAVVRSARALHDAPKFSTPVVSALEQLRDVLKAMEEALTQAGKAAGAFGALVLQIAGAVKLLDVLLKALQ